MYKSSRRFDVTAKVRFDAISLRLWAETRKHSYMSGRVAVAAKPTQTHVLIWFSTAQNTGAAVPLAPKTAQLTNRNMYDGSLTSRGQNPVPLVFRRSDCSATNQNTGVS